MQKLKINEEFKNLIPPLTEEEREGLEKSLLMFGCRDKIVTWQGFIIDGHNRFELCEKNDIDFQTFSMDYEFETEEEVKQWIIKNQFARRNISVYQRSVLALKLKENIAKKAKENQGIRNDLTSVRNMTNVKSNEGSTFKEIVSEKNSTNNKPAIASIDTKKELAKIAGVSHDTIHKVEIIEHEAPTVIKDAAKENHISVNKAYNITKEVKDLEEDEKQDKATELLNKQYDAKAKEIDKEKKIADKIADAIFGILTVDVDEERIGYYLEYSPQESLDKHISRCDEAIEKLQKVKSIFQNIRKIRVVK